MFRLCVSVTIRVSPLAVRAVRETLRRTAKVACVDERERRMAENETLFREVNERVEDTATQFVGEDEDSAHEYFCGMRERRLHLPRQTLT